MPYSGSPDGNVPVNFETRYTAINSRPRQEMAVSWFAVNGMLASARSWITCG
jgi:hypothetical protein